MRRPDWTLRIAFDTVESCRSGEEVLAAHEPDMEVYVKDDDSYALFVDTRPDDAAYRVAGRVRGYLRGAGLDASVSIERRP